MKVLASLIVIAAVGQLCSAQDTTCPIVDCAPGTAVECFVDPCTTATCLLYPSATCCSNYCGGCNAVFFQSGSSVTCDLPHNSQCPPPGIGTCAISCRSDEECTNSQICCRNGCGTSCQNPVDPCALVLCPAVVCGPNQISVTPEGECCPQCVDACTAPDGTKVAVGTIVPMDCNTCTCLAGADGVAPALACTLIACAPTCTAPDGTAVAVGDTFTAADGCNTCTCTDSGNAVCTLRACLDICVQPQRVGVCLAAFRRYWYDSATGVCREFIYGGCGGNQNNFETIGECLDLCNPNSTCAATVYPNDQQPLCLIASQPRWTFNVTSGQCERISYIPCQSSDGFNVYQTEEECTQQCISGGDPSCAAVSCIQVVCGPDQITVTPEGECCPQCQDVCTAPDGTKVAVGTSIPVECNTCTCLAGADGAAPALACTEIACVDPCATVRCADPMCQPEELAVTPPGQCCQVCIRACRVNGTVIRVGETVQNDCNLCTCTATQSDTGPISLVVCTDQNCTASTCTAPDGTEVAVGESFIARDGCNRCVCGIGGQAACTLAFCIDRCHLPQVVGDCDAAFRRYWYDSATGVCREFTYGGCGGNDNNFETIGECLDVCSPNSTCAATVYPNDQQPLCLIASQPRWTFNVTSGQCERISYIPCQSSDGFNVYQTEEECTQQCISGEDPGCPPGVPIVFCFADPCQVNSCPNFPEAECQSNYCGGCNALFFDADGNEVTDRCGTGSACEDGSPIVDCYVDPCTVSSCPNHREAECRANYCGGCRAWYFDGETNVTDTCRDTTSLPTPLQSLQCPAVGASTFGSCVVTCSSHSDCDDDLLCCSNGCGFTCRAGEPIPYYEIPLICPAPSVDDLIGTCQITNNSCLSDDECMKSDQRCCRSGCGRSCQRANQPSTPCFAVTDQFPIATGGLLGGLVGTFIPHCLDDGSFAPIQCHGSTGYCWCVHTRTGEPISPRSPPGSMPPACATCEEGGVTYYPGQSYTASDGCNTCTCSENGLSFCTRRACPLTPCNESAEPGNCRGYFPAYYHDPADGMCKSFIYGGCGGNDNKFKTVGDCLRRCNSDSICLLPPVTGLCEAYIPSFFYNSTSGRCEQFVYGGCGGNDNRFPTGERCQAACDRDAEIVDRCLGIACDPIVCPTGQRFVPDDSCCGGTCSSIECSDNQMMCRDGSSCVDMERVCDVIEDCDDGSDEVDCPGPPSDCENGFLCGTQECIPSHYVCDNYTDCRDYSDEQGCFDLPPNTQFIRDAPLECPAVTDRLVGCEEASCEANTDCEGPGELCCPTSCDGASKCTLGDPVRPRCSALRRLLSARRDTSIFIPDCDGDGFFSPVQCFRDYCWCVDVETGYPVTAGNNEERPVCPGCQMRSDDPTSTISIGETYPDEDGCNVCLCTIDYPTRPQCTNDRCPG